MCFVAEKVEILLGVLEPPVTIYVPIIDVYIESFCTRSFECIFLIKCYKISESIQYITISLLNKLVCPSSKNSLKIVAKNGQKSSKNGDFFTKFLCLNCPLCPFQGHHLTWRNLKVYYGLFSAVFWVKRSHQFLCFLIVNLIFFFL